MTQCSYQMFFANDIIWPGQYYTEDQLMNIFSFSLLYEWLLGIAQSFRSIENRISIDGAASSRDDMVKKMLGSLISRSVDYCFRVIDQCEKSKPVLICFTLVHHFHVSLSFVYIVLTLSLPQEEKRTFSCLPE